MVSTSFVTRMPKIVACSDLKSADFDGVVVVTEATSKLTGKLQPLATVLDDYAKVKLMKTPCACRHMHAGMHMHAHAGTHKHTHTHE